MLAVLFPFRKHSTETGHEQLKAQIIRGQVCELEPRKDFQVKIYIPGPYSGHRPKQGLSGFRLCLLLQPVWTSVLCTQHMSERSPGLAGHNPLCCQSFTHGLSTNALGWLSPKHQLLCVALCSAFFDVTFHWVHTWEELQG